MTGSTIALIVCVAAIWMSQRLLTIWQSLRFRRQLIALREHGKLSVGMAKKIGRRVFVGLTVDQQRHRDREPGAARRHGVRPR